MASSTHESAFSNSSTEWCPSHRKDTISERPNSNDTRSQQANGFLQRQVSLASSARLHPATRSTAGLHPRPNLLGHGHQRPFQLRLPPPRSCRRLHHTHPPRSATAAAIAAAATVAAAAALLPPTPTPASSPAPAPTSATDTAPCRHYNASYPRSPARGRVLANNLSPREEGPSPGLAALLAEPVGRAASQGLCYTTRGGFVGGGVERTSPTDRGGGGGSGGHRRCSRE